MNSEKTDFFTVSRSELISFMMSSLGISWMLWMVAGIGLMLVVVGAFGDLRVMALGFIVCLAIAPTMAFFIYFTNLIDARIMFNMLPHTVEPKTDYYLVEIFREDFHKNDDGDMESSWVRSAKMTIFGSKVTKRVDKGQYSVLYLVDSPAKVLYIPRGMNLSPTAVN